MMLRLGWARLGRAGGLNQWDSRPTSSLRVCAGRLDHKAAEAGDLTFISSCDTPAPGEPNAV